jgi:hypothetical protein
MKRIIAISGLIVGLALVGSYFSPHLTVYQMKSAIKNHDADAFSEHVDFPALRENFKGQMMAFMNKELSTPEMKQNPFAGFGQAMAVALIGPMIDAMITPAGVIVMMENGNTKPIQAKSNDPTPNDSTGQSVPPKYSISYQGWSRVVARPKDQEQDVGSFIFKRQGLWSWKLSAVNLPESALRSQR